MESRRLLAAQFVADLQPATASADLYSRTALGSRVVFWNGTSLYATTGSAGDVTLLRSGFGSLGNQPDFVVMNGFAYFPSKSSNSSTTASLWRTDGTVAGTELVSDAKTSVLYLCNGWLYWGTFVSGATQLWKSDGTTASTAMVHQFANADQPPTNMTYYNGFVYFSYATPGNFFDTELWRTDGTDAGTTFFKDIYVGNTESQPESLSVSNGLLYFAAASSGTGREPWKSDGTVAGTTLLKDVVGGTGSSDPKYFTPINATTTLFSAGEDLWRTDGTTANTARVKTGGPRPQTPLVLMNGIAYFQGHTFENGEELWRSDGTSAGTTMVKDIAPGTIGSYPDYLTVSAGTLYFCGYDGVAPGMWIWKSDGTGANTVPVTNLSAGISHLTAVNGGVYFRGDDGVHGSEPWFSDGTPAGTAMITDLNATPFSSNPGGDFPAFNTLSVSGTWQAANIGDVAIFASDGGRLWRSDGTAAGTQLITRFTQSNATIRHLTAWSGSVYFVLDTGSNYSVWRTDGTETGTVQLILRTDGPRRKTFAPLGNNLYFFLGNNLYRTDGTPGGTVQITNSLAGLTSPDDVTVAGARIYFIAGNSTRAVWTSDGTSAGTMPLSSLVSGFVVYNPAELTPLGSSIYFTGKAVNDGNNDAGIYKTDGTIGGSALVMAGITPTSVNTTGYIPAFLTTLGDALYFAGWKSTSGWELWRSQGTAGTTSMLAELAAGTADSRPQWLVTSGNRLYFSAKTPATGRELCTSDGTAAGTIMLGDVNPGAASSITEPNAVSGMFEWPIYSAPNSSAFVEANDGSSGLELWQTSGTLTSTTRVADVNAGALSSNARPMAVVKPAGAEQLMLFSAEEPTHGRELWSASAVASFASIVNRVLVINGTPGNDALALHQNGAAVAVSMGGQMLSFALKDFDSILPATGSGLDSLSVVSGSYAITSDVSPGSAALSVDVGASASLTFSSSQHLDNLNVAGTVSLLANGAQLLSIKSLSIPGSGVLDLNDNDLLLDYAPSRSPILDMIQNLINTARAGGSWTGTGLTSSAARTNPQHNTTLGAMESIDFRSVYGAGALFDGESVDNSAILVKYTWYGDIDFNGKVDGADYARIDATFNQQVATDTNIGGWFNGDLDYNGKIDGADYALIDAAFNSQDSLIRVGKKLRR